MHAALAAGAHLVNEVSALRGDERALELVVRAGCPVILMHSPDPAKGPHGGNGYADVLTEVFDWLETRIDAVVAAGVDRAKIIADPGIGFGKSLADTLALLRSEERRVGKECGSKCRTRWAPDKIKKKKTNS